MAARARRSPKKKHLEAPPDRITGAPLSPIGTVERELVRPDGSRITVKVPVYPPFRLQEREAKTDALKKRVPAQKKAS